MFYTPSHVRCAPGDRGITLFDLDSQEALELNMVGSFIWQHLQDGDSFVSIVQALSATTGANAAQVERDTWMFIERLMSKGLVVRTISSLIK